MAPVMASRMGVVIIHYRRRHAQGRLQPRCVWWQCLPADHGIGPDGLHDRLGVSCGRTAEVYTITATTGFVPAEWLHRSTRAAPMQA